jgi:hypothetical protein
VNDFVKITYEARAADDCPLKVTIMAGREWLDTDDHAWSALRLRLILKWERALAYHDHEYVHPALPTEDVA